MHTSLRQTLSSFMAGHHTSIVILVQKREKELIDRSRVAPWNHALPTMWLSAISLVGCFTAEEG